MGCAKPSFEPKPNLASIGGHRKIIEYRKRAVLFSQGGPAERERNRRILRKTRGAVIDGGCENTLGQFAALVQLCDVVVTGDTTALHLAIGLKRKVVALFGPTCAQEIELYGRGVKISSSLSCAPCYRRSCETSPNCMEAISAEEVVKKVRGILPALQKAKKS